MKNLSKELRYILDYWADVVFDQQNNIFYGQVNEHNIPNGTAPRGVVMYARILWAFSAAFKFTHDPRDEKMALYAYTGLTRLFRDDKYGGVYWMVDAGGNPLEKKKQIYAQAFVIYGLTEYYSITNNREVLDEAIRLYRLIEEYSFDPEHGGYFEAFNNDWSMATDLRLSEKDDNACKTLNTHLHIMEAYVNLYRMWPDMQLASAIRRLIGLFDLHFIHKSTSHLVLFFNETWLPTSTVISYGHDIEASWLLCEAAAVLDDTLLIKYTEGIAPFIVDAALEGWEMEGGLNYEYISDTNHLVNEKHWWVQAEAVVGLLNVWQITGYDHYKELFEDSWAFIIQHIIDHQNGEWFWGLNADGTVMQGQDKAGIWKCPYHNTRCILEIMKRVKVNSLPL